MCININNSTAKELIKLSLEELLELNSGYNPEELNLEFFEVIEETKDSIVIREKDLDRKYFYYRTPCDTLKEYICYFPKVAGLQYKGKFYHCD